MFKTARHSSLLRLSGYDMSDDFEAEEPNRAPRMGMPDMDRRGGGLRNALRPTRGGAGRKRKWERVWRKVAKNGLYRMEMDATNETVWDGN